MINVGIVGGTGYTGVELLRILVVHPEVSLKIITSRTELGKPVADVYPNLRHYTDIVFSEPNVKELASCDLVFFATPNGIAMKMVPELLDNGVKVIDLAADFRIIDPLEYKSWYGIDHVCPELLSEAVYGLPELNREKIKSAKLVANPGCYPTAIQLGWLPLIKNQCIDLDFLIADAKSGVSGAGRNPSVTSLCAEVSEDFKAYGASGHRHLPEIKQTLESVSIEPVNLTFIPHLVPMVRGIHATLYCRLKPGIEKDLSQLYAEYYQNEVFVDVLPASSHPSVKSVKGSNFCRISIHQLERSDTIVILSVIDNLVKGASGQAVHNMNLMMGFDESLGLMQVPLMP
ncbi:MAG: N-acetyl-gamma-glutamyl-phosphate reductase [Methylococcales bacterium]|jgi:N-acetyl-gamma-glutamyl-phosphate reductase|nr:N-acetyl-gamma-glutamyl-phosphate reductase [Methylococcales bacterium]MBT7409675.1 N-acetyl-gamma-glutamyl-phosphate reductase [Methylococcales bacterium]